MEKSKKWPQILIGIVLLSAGIFVGKTWFNPPVAIPLPVAYTNNEGGNAGVIPSSYDPVNGKIIEVKDGDKIQDAVVEAKSGDLIRVYPGVYNETVYIDKDGITLQGVTINSEWATLDGQSQLNDAFLYSGNNITIENFKIVKYKGNAIMGQAGNNYVIRNNWIIDTGVYGIFPQFGKNGLIEYNILSGIEDAAIYVGMCDNVDVKFNEVFESVAGIEIENSRHALVESNYVHDNTGGILVFITPGLPIKTTFDVIVRNNFVVNNNTPNFAIPGSMVSSIPRGTGIVIMAADDVIVENNIISGNINAGIAITDLSFGAQISKDPDSDPYPDRLVILDNLMHGNGTDPIEEIKVAMMTQLSDLGPDIVAVGGGTGSTIRNRNQYRTFGIGGYGEATITNTKNVKTFLLDEMVQPRSITASERAKLTYYGICAGCHAYDIKMIGPPTKIIQALYKNNPEGIAEYAANPVKKRQDFAEMPPQKHIDDETRLEVAKFMLSLTK
ncbi:MAG: parallel beta-helix domain-containing protein [Reichenbachiella sp.]|uniref:parallel beta-helix domain-containing protein n=1 Tax=Reichenbachiella sp. TaxID=2184521 RepID=UPI00329A64CC